MRADFYATVFVLLIVLHFLKTMPNEDIASCMFGICRNTYRDKLWRAVTHLNLVMSEINIEERLEGPVCSTGMFKNVRIIVDGTDCPIFTPGSKAERLAHKSGRKKRQFILRLQPKIYNRCAYSYWTNPLYIWTYSRCRS